MKFDYNIISVHKIGGLFMKEIEIKILNVDIDKLRRDVLKHGGSLVKKENQENYIYFLPDNLKNTPGYVRVRRIYNLLNGTKKDILCIKKILSQEKFKITEEHEVEVMDFNECSMFLNSAGIRFNKRQDKYRESYKFNGVLIEIDIWDKNVFPYPYLEIEAVDENRIFETMDLLEIPRDKATSKSLEEIKIEMGLI